MGHPDIEVLPWRVVKRGTQGQVTLEGRLSYGRPVLDPEFWERSQGQGVELGTLDSLLPVTCCFFAISAEWSPCCGNTSGASGRVGSAPGGVSVSPRGSCSFWNLPDRTTHISQGNQ